jgi:hypothetical protein
VYHWVCLKWFSILWYVRRKWCTYLASRLALSPNRLKQVTTWAWSPRSTIGCIPKMIYDLRLAQTVHLSCTASNSVSKWIETRFHMTNVTEEIHRVCPKWFLSLWYVRRKPCTYLMSRLALCPNWPERASTWASSPRSTIGCVQNDFYAMFSANRAPILQWHYQCLQMDWNEIPHDQCDIGDLSGASKMISDPMLHSTQTVHLSCVKISTISKQTKTSIHLSLIT